MDSSYFRMLARYNRWANARLYEACARLPAEEFARPRAAFFGSIKGTLNHLVVGDRAWLDRLEGIATQIHSYNQEMARDFESLARIRGEQDARLIALIDDLGADELAATLYYTTISGVRAETPTYLAIAHLFNHQTHHRGQAHDQLSQTDVAPPPLDLIFYLRELPSPAAG
jgi:uncharacterized damage-inducible protein DinB